MRGKPSRKLLNEKGKCRWCGQPVPMGRRSWCGDGCVEEFRLERWPSYLRSKVFDRDHGVCFQCGRDCHRLMGRIDLLTKVGFRNFTVDEYRKKIRIEKWLRRCGVTFATSGTIYSLWEADHIVSVVEGGLNRLDNMRTLCRSCHKAETRVLRARLAAKKRAG